MSLKRYRKLFPVFLLTIIIIGSIGLRFYNDKHVRTSGILRSYDKNLIYNTIPSYRIVKIEYDTVSDKIVFSVIVRQDTKRKQFKMLVEDYKKRFFRYNRVQNMQFLFYYANPDVTKKYSFGEAEWSETMGWNFNLKPPIRTKDPSIIPHTSLQGEIMDYYSLRVRSHGNPYNQIPYRGADLEKWTENYTSIVQEWHRRLLLETANRYHISFNKVQEIYYKFQSNKYPLAPEYEFD